MIEGDWSGRVAGLRDQRVEIAICVCGRPRRDRTLVLSHAACGCRSPERPVNALGSLRVKAESRSEGTGIRALPCVPKQAAILVFKPDRAGIGELRRQPDGIAAHEAVVVLDCGGEFGQGATQPDGGRQRQPSRSLRQGRAGAVTNAPRSASRREAGDDGLQRTRRTPSWEAGSQGDVEAGDRLWLRRRVQSFNAPRARPP